MKIDGRCHCGYVTFEAEADPETTTICNCTGAEYKLAGGWSALAKFDGEFSNTTAIYSGSGVIRKVW